MTGLLASVVGLNPRPAPSTGWLGMGLVERDYSWSLIKLFSNLYLEAKCQGIEEVSMTQLRTRLNFQTIRAEKTSRDIKTKFFKPFRSKDRERLILLT